MVCCKSDQLIVDNFYENAVEQSFLLTELNVDERMNFEENSLLIIFILKKVLSQVNCHIDIT